MGLGNKYDNGNKGSNYNWQKRVIQILNRCCSFISGNVPEPFTVLGPRYGVCDSTQTYTITGNHGSTTSYTWDVPSGVSIVGDPNIDTVELTFDSGFVSGVVRVWATNEFGNSSIYYLFITAVPEAITEITGPTEVSDSESGLEYDCSFSFGATSYNWSVPMDASIIAGSGTRTIIVDWGSTSGQVSVEAENACGKRALFSINVNVI